MISLGESELELLGNLLEHNVSFALICGHAVRAHGHERPVGDLDILVRASPENAARIRAALAKVGFDLTPELQERMAQPEANCLLRTFNAQLLGKMAGVNSEAALAASAPFTCGALQIPVISREHLIATKLALARPLDLSDAQALRAVSNV